MRMHPRHVLIFTLVVAALAMSGSSLSAGDPGSGSWPMWGGSPDRNMVSNAKGMPTEWDVKTGKNIKWSAELGSQSYGNLVVAGGMVFIGTNNEKVRDPKQPGDRGVLMAFREADGEFLWQQTHVKLEAGRATYFPGPWHAWRREKAERAQHAAKTADRISDDIERLERFVARFRYKKSKAKQAQAKLTQISRLEKERAGARAEHDLLTRRSRRLG